MTDIGNGTRQTFYTSDDLEIKGLYPWTDLSRRKPCPQYENIKEF